MRLSEGFSRLTPSVPVLLETLFQSAREGNTTARAIFRRAGRYLAVGLANVVNLFDPALIILSGVRMQYDYLYATETLAEMQDRAHRYCFIANTLADSVAQVKVQAHPYELATLQAFLAGSIHAQGAAVTVHDTDGSVLTGTFAGLEESDGALRLRLADGRERVIRAGDIA